MKRSSRTPIGGFTLIELMISVAIIGLLASLAIPEYLNMQLRARRSELTVNLKGMATSQQAYHKLYEDYVACAVSPQSSLDRRQHEFEADRAGWADLGWNPDGLVYCHYSAELISVGVLGNWVRNKALCDLDNDNASAQWWMDVDARRLSPSSQNFVLRPSPATEANNRW